VLGHHGILPLAPAKPHERNAVLRHEALQPSPRSPG
jgi:hypothetical protein